MPGFLERLPCFFLKRKPFCGDREVPFGIRTIPSLELLAEALPALTLDVMQDCPIDEAAPVSPGGHPVEYIHGLFGKDDIDALAHGFADCRAVSPACRTA